MKSFFLLLSIFSLNLFTYTGYGQTATNKEEYVFVEQMPSFVGGVEVMSQFLAKNIKYPEKAKQENIEGRIVAQFLVTSTGKIEDIKILKEIGGGCGEEAIRAIKMMPNWLPGKQNGQNVNVRITIPLQFSLTDDENIIDESIAQFPGGEFAMKNFVLQNLKYPKKAKKKKLEGVTAIQFEVDENGNISNPLLINKLGNGFDEEAIRLFSLLPKKWLPAKAQGKAIKSSFVLPIEFKLKKS
jgi:TonB family protein